MKTIKINQIPEKTKEFYQLEIEKKHIAIHRPCYINIDINDEFEIRDNRYDFEIYNGKVSVSLYKKEQDMTKVHITVF